MPSTSAARLASPAAYRASVSASIHVTVAVVIHSRACSPPSIQKPGAAFALSEPVTLSVTISRPSYDAPIETISQMSACVAAISRIHAIVSLNVWYSLRSNDAPDARDGGIARAAAASVSSIIVSTASPARSPFASVALSAAHCAAPWHMMPTDTMTARGSCQTPNASSESESIRSERSWRSVIGVARSTCDLRVLVRDARRRARRQGEHHREMQLHLAGPGVYGV